jgi:hypothetical protein
MACEPAATVWFMSCAVWNGYCCAMSHWLYCAVRLGLLLRGLLLRPWCSAPGDTELLVLETFERVRAAQLSG